MKLLIITGLMAQETIKQYIVEYNVESEISALKVPVAALITLNQIEDFLKRTDVKKFDLILIPGLIQGDTTILSKTFEIPIYKGPKYAADLPIVLDSLEKIKLSTILPACDMLRKELKQKALQDLEIVEKDKDKLLKKPGNMLIGQMAVGKDFPMRVMAEIVDAALMSNNEIQKLAQLYVKNGADIIDVGMVAGGSRPLDAKRAVEAIKKVVNVPVSIDSLDPEEIKWAVKAGADMVLSADAGNLEEIATVIAEIPVVFIPTNQSEGYFPNEIDDRVKFLEEIIHKGRRMGIKKIFADLILEPYNLLESLIAFYNFAKKYPDIPLFVGVSNITELFDADSIGINALLAYLSSELKTSILLATEKSNKAKGTVKEESIASKMMFIARKRNSYPKDLGIDLLVLKDKRKFEESYNNDLEAKTKVIKTNNVSDEIILDSHGEFKILLDRKTENIVALHFPNSQIQIPSNIIKGKTAKAVYNKIIQMDLITRLDHSAYLGNELAKAEIALKTGKEYLQDEKLFDI